MIEHGAVLCHDVRFGRIGGDAEIAEHRAGVDAAIDSQERHADVLMIAGRARPEAPMCVAVLGADAGMHHEGAQLRDREHLFLQQRLAPRDDEVGRAIPDERFGFGGVR